MTAVTESVPLIAADSQRRAQRALIPAVAVGVPAGAVLIVLAYHHAAGLPAPDNTQFALYWAGFLIGMVPLVALACAHRVDAVMRTAALVGIGLFGMVPRLQRSGPAGSDEFIHLRQSMEAFYGGEVGHPLFLLPISQEFFGLHQLSSALARLSGLALWSAGLVVVILAHILSVLAVYQLIRLVDVPAPGAAVGAVVYTLNPSWLYFNAGFAYESLALPLVLWCLAAAVGAGRATGKPAVGSVAAGLFCVAVLPTIHHLSTILLLLILALLIAARLTLWFPRAALLGLDACPERVWPMAVIWFGLLGSIHLWWSNKYDWLLSYLSPAWTEGFSQLSKIADGIGRSSGQRSLFGNALNPIYEVISGYLYPFVVLALFIWSLRIVWRRRARVGTAVWGFAALGSMFFASLPMLLTHGGSEGAHRSWGYSFIGIAVLCGFAWSHGPDSAMSAMARSPGIRSSVALIVFTVLAFGSAALGASVSVRFPGSAYVGDDARSVSKEAAAVADWMAVNAPFDTPVMADRYVSLQIGSLGRMSALRPSETFPVWDLYMKSAPVAPEVLKNIFDSDIRYFVVDSRMSTTRPRLGYWFTRNEPGVRGDDPFPQSALDRFDCLPWLRGVYAAGPLTVYQLDRDSLLERETGSCEVPSK